jgi:hypothetical protein
MFLRIGFPMKFLLFLLLSVFALLNTNSLVNVTLTICLLLIVIGTGFPRHNAAPFVLLLISLTVFTIFWLLLSSVSGDVTYIQWPWGTIISDATITAVLHAVTRWSLVFVSGLLFVIITREQEILRFFISIGVPSDVVMIFTIALNTFGFAVKDLPGVSYSLAARCHETRGIIRSLNKFRYIGSALVLINLKRIDTLSQSYRLRHEHAEHKA